MVDNRYVVVYAKFPQRGKVKSRLASETSPDFAYDLSMALIEDLVPKIQSGSHETRFLADTTDEESLFEEHFGLRSFVYGRDIPQGNNQSEKFHNTFAQLVNVHRKNTILIPMDNPYVDAHLLENAFEALDSERFAVGPESNGGVYLIGCSRPYSKDLFDGVRWSTRKTYRDLMGGAKGSVHELETTGDINEFSDLSLHFKQLMRHNPRCRSLIEQRLMLSEVA